MKSIPACFAVDAARRHGYKLMLDPSITRFGKDR